MKKLWFLNFVFILSANTASLNADEALVPSVAEERHDMLEVQEDSICYLPASDAANWQKQQEFFQEHGYLWIKNFFSSEQVNYLQSWAAEIHNASKKLLQQSQNTGLSLQYMAKTIPGTLIIVPEAGNPLQACRAEDILSCYPEMHSFISGTVTTYISRLFNEPYVAFKDKINFKWPGGGAFQPHQDFPAYELFGPREHVTAMVCIDEATIKNGCLYVAKNWKKDLKGEASVNQEELQKGRAVLPYVVGGKDHGSIQPQCTEKITWLALEAAPGDLVLFNSFLPHYSEPNRSEKARRAMFLTHNREEEGDHRQAYYQAKRQDGDNPVFHFATPTKARNKD